MTTLDTDKVYEWFVVESKVITRQGRTYMVLASACVTEDYTIREEYLIDPLTILSTSLCDRITRMYPDHSKDGQPATLVLPKGLHYFAKVQAMWPTRATSQQLYYVLNPLTTTTVTPHQERTPLPLQSEVLRVVAKKLSRQATTTELEQMGSEYVREYRAMLKSGAIPS